MSRKTAPNATKAEQRRQAADALFSLGLNWHLKGEWGHAKAIYEQVLSSEPRHFDALHMLGVLALQGNDAQRAEQLMSKAIAADPRHAQAYSNRGNALKALGRLDEAVLSYREAIERKPDYVEAHTNLGNALRDLGQYEAAEAAFGQALSLKPDFAEAHFNLGGVLERLGRLDESRGAFERALQLQPQHTESHTNLANLLKKTGRSDAALFHYREAARLSPGSAEAQTNLGIGLHDGGNLVEALAQFDRAIEIHPEFAQSYSNRAATLQGLGRIPDALHSANRAIELRADYAQAHCNKGLALSAMGQWEGALAAYDRAIELAPDLVEAKCNKALALLTHRQFQAGWPLFQYRDRSGGAMPMARLSGVPIWAFGSPVTRALLLAEQGIGDEVLFTKCLGLFIQRFGAPACVAVDRRLISIFERSFPELRFIDRLQMHQLIPSEFDIQLALGDLPLLLSVDPTESPQVSAPHLVVNENLSNQLIQLGAPALRPRIGLSWRSKNARFGAEKSIRLFDLMSKLIEIDADWVNLQYGDVDEEIAHAREELGVTIHQIDELDVTQDLDGLLKLIHDCDFVITTSNSTAHLCGSIGKPGVVMVPYGTGKLWYWHLEDGPSIWYPSLYVLHCKQPNGWQQVLAQIQQRLKDKHELTH